MVPSRKDREMQSDIRLVIITGLSGAGKTQAVRVLEDLGYFCVDNIPPTLIPKFAELCEQSAGRVKRIALVVDIRGGEFFDKTFEVLESLDRVGFAYRILFLEAQDETLIRRFKETRRRHPLAPHGRILEGIKEERSKLEGIRGRAGHIIDTTNLTPQALREEIIKLFGRDKELHPLIVNVVSFGFKYGLPLDADLVFDVRFLPNPQYVKSLKSLDGNDPMIDEYVFKWPISNRFMRRLYSFISFLLPHYISEGKSQLTIAIGCTGGQHRSVAVSNRLAEFLREKQHVVVVEHRDVDKEVARKTLLGTGEE